LTVENTRNSDFTRFDKVVVTDCIYIGESGDGGLYITPDGISNHKTVDDAFPVGQQFTVTIPNIAAATVGKPLWIAPAPCMIVSAAERHITVCDAADTMTLEKVPSGTAAGSGTVVLAGNFTLNSTANTVVTVLQSATEAAYTLAEDDTLHLKFVSGDGTNYAGGAITITGTWS